jgi:pyruvate dehydrogenase E2 component (dihydrolipoamide acetyltransferase)
MATEVVMPKMGYDMEEGTILRWLKHEGDSVAKGDILAEIETGKVSIEMEAFDEGILRAVIAKEGDTVPVGTPIAILGTADEPITVPEIVRNGNKGEVAGDAPPVAAAASADADSSPREDGVPAATESGEPGGRVKASPVARRLAGEHGLPLASVGEGTGPGGRIVRDDVAAALARGPAAPTASAVQPREARREQLSGMRRTIARRLSESWQGAPHIFVTMAVEMDRAQALRADINDLSGEDGPKLSLNDLVVKAVARALVEHPRLNVSWEDGERVVHGAVNIGVAVALEDGLMTIAVADADRKSVSAVSSELRDKAERARTGKLHADDLSVRSTFTVTNMGMYGVESFTAIINPPEAAILAVGAATPEAVVRDGHIVARSMMRLTLSADHRVVDGATAALFLARVKELLEHPAAALA